MLHNMFKGSVAHGNGGVSLIPIRLIRHLARSRTWEWQ